MLTESDPLATERENFAALSSTNNAHTLDRLLTEDFILVDVMAGNEISKPALLAAVASRQVKFDAIVPAEPRVRLYSTTAVITGRTHMTGQFGGAPFTVSSRYTHVFVRQSGRCAHGLSPRHTDTHRLNCFARTEACWYGEMMKWEQLCDDATLENIPYRVELSRHGRLVMSPHRSYHSIYQSRIIRWLNQLLPDGEAMPECPIKTSIGVVVADVAWASSQKVKRNFDLPSWIESPEIVVEVLSPSNLDEEIRRKREAVFAEGAVEFWTCDKEGTLQFFGPRGKLAKSKFCPKFPPTVAKASLR